nr:MBL fold metallo-hydrolase [Bradyrhizobium sp. CSS354]
MARLGGDIHRHTAFGGSARCSAQYFGHRPRYPVALSYRFDTADRSIVFSGDTRKTDALINLAKGADVFVCEAQYLPGMRQVLDAAVKVGRFDKETADNLFKSVSRNALTLEQAGEVAQAAGVKTLVLSHFVPGNGAVHDQVFVDEARKAFSGEGGGRAPEWDDFHSTYRSKHTAAVCQRRWAARNVTDARRNAAATEAGGTG